jgi:DNA-binding beta-propeller fold protein YncE
MNTQTLRCSGYVALPKHADKGGFDHAAVHAASGHVYVAHTANDAVDVFDPAAGQYLFSIPGLRGVAGVLVSDEASLIFTSNRGENTVGIFEPGRDPQVTKVAVGIGPNGLAYDPGRNVLLVANVGDPEIPASYTLTVVDVDQRAVRAEIPVPGRTRWALYDADTDAFYVNIADPAVIVVVPAGDPCRVTRTIVIPAAGPHGLDLDPESHRLFCACDAGTLIVLDPRAGTILDRQPLSGTPDVVFFSRQRKRLYVAIGNPGVIDVFDTQTMARIDVIVTEKGAHTFALSPRGDGICAFLPGTHRAAIYQPAQHEREYREPLWWLWKGAAQ